MRLFNKLVPVAAAVGFAAAAWAAPASAAVDWNTVQGKDITLFYPGQASWEWVLTPTSHSGAPVFREGKNCHECHRGEEDKMGDTIVSGKKLEPNPIPGKLGSVKANIKMARDADRMYVRLEFPDTPLAGQKMDPDNETKVTIMLSDGKVAEATRAGCWGTCHEDMVFMPHAQPGKDVTKYLVRSCAKMSAQGCADKKSAADIAALKADGQDLEYWQARLNPGKPAAADEGFVLASRDFAPAKEVSAEGKLENGKWVVVLSRKLAESAPFKPIEAGKVYTVGFAIHGGYAARRYHWVSMDTTFAVGSGTADFLVK
jgi:hypothetical protein